MNQISKENEELLKRLITDGFTDVHASVILKCMRNNIPVEKLTNGYFRNVELNAISKGIDRNVNLIDVVGNLKVEIDDDDIKMLIRASKLGVDITEYFNNRVYKYEIEMYLKYLKQGVDISNYLSSGYCYFKLELIAKGLMDGLDVTWYQGANEYMDIFSSIQKIESLLYKKKKLENKDLSKWWNRFRLKMVMFKLKFHYITVR